MKPLNSTISVLIIIISIALTGCESSRDNVTGLRMATVWESGNESWSNMSDICICIYNVQGKMVTEQRFASAAEMVSALIPLPAADYTMLTTAKLNDPITTVHATSLINEFRTKSDIPQKREDRAFYAITKVRVLPRGITTASVGNSRVLSELSFEIDGVPYGMRFNASITDVESLEEDSHLHVTMTDTDGDTNECDIRVMKVYPFGHYVLQLDYGHINHSANLSSIRIDDVADGWTIKGSVGNPTI